MDSIQTKQDFLSESVSAKETKKAKRKTEYKIGGLVEMKDVLADVI